MEDNPLIIEVAGVNKIFRHDWTYQKKQVLFDVGFTVKKGEVFGFVGPNGAGKTTTIKMLLDLVRPTSGTIRLLGASPSDRKMRQRVGFLPERPYFYEHLTAREIMSLYARLSLAPHADIPALLKLVGLSDTGNLPLKRFSKGMLQRLGLAQALCADPELVILDEPMSGLDPVGRREVRDVLLDLRARGKTIFFSSHILPDVEMLCDRVAMIFKGRIHTVGEVRELVSRAGQDAADITVRLQPGQSLPPLATHFRALAADEFQGTVETRGLQPTLQALLGAGVEVREVVPRRGSLEDEFLRGMNA